MLPAKHAFLGFLFSLVLYLFFPETIGLIGALIIFASSVLIDIDHYLYYIYKTKNYSLKKSISWFFINKDKFEKMEKKQKNNIYTGLCFLHGAEALIILLLLALVSNMYSRFFIFIFIGFVFHLILDTIDLYIRNYRFDKVISYLYSLKNSKDKTLLQDLK